jgi:hypothetical protein
MILQNVLDLMTSGQYMGSQRSKYVKNKVTGFALKCNHIIWYIDHKKFKTYFDDLRGQGQGRDQLIL